MLSHSLNLITTTERFVLRIIAEQYQDRYSSANFELQLICEETGISRRQGRTDFGKRDFGKRWSCVGVHGRQWRSGNFGLAWLETISSQAPRF